MIFLFLTVVPWLVPRMRSHQIPLLFASVSLEPVRWNVAFPPLSRANVRSLTPFSSSPFCLEPLSLSLASPLLFFAYFSKPRCCAFTIHPRLVSSLDPNVDASGLEGQQGPPFRCFVFFLSIKRTILDPRVAVRVPIWFGVGYSRKSRNEEISTIVGEIMEIFMYALINRGL